eukprot:s4293_g3.t1
MLNVCSLASLEAYAKQVEKLTTQWPRCWGLIYLADDAARAEKLEKWRRKLTIEAAQSRQVPRDWDPLRPWSCIFVQIASDMEFWAERVHHPAAAWVAAGGRGAPTVASEAAVLEVIQGGPKAMAHESEATHGQPDSRKTQANRDRRQAKRRRQAADREELSRYRSSATSSNAKGGQPQKGKGKGKSKDQSGLELCFSWASGKGACADVPPGGECKGAGAFPFSPWLKDQGRRKVQGSRPQISMGMTLSRRRLLWRSRQETKLLEDQVEIKVLEDMSRKKNQASSPTHDAAQSSGTGVLTAPESETQGKEEPWVPDRVAKALEKSKTFDEFRKARPFRYLHIFSGEKDQLGASIVEEAKKARLEVYVESLDRKKDSDLNLVSHAVYDEIEKSVCGGEWDGLHSGFPCASFSRVRWRDSPEGALPVRSADHIYGLPRNTPSQQKEADDGTLMAVRSGWLHQKQVEASKRRAVPEISTLENPPGAEHTGSAWDLPELQAVIADTQSSSVEFNTCAYESKLKQRWYKPARWTGKLENLASLARVCKCPNWVQHVPVVGKRNTEAAGAYPEELTAIIAKKIVEAWKRILNLEWLRHQMKEKTSKINELQVKWLENEERRRKRVYEETGPSVTNPLTKEPKKAKFDSKALEANESEGEAMPSSSAFPSRKRIREEENDFAIGGMRNPAVSVSKLHQVEAVGKQIHEAWLEFVRENPIALEAAINYGSKEAKLHEDIVLKWRKRLEKLLDVKEPEGVTLREEIEFKSPLHQELWDAWGSAARDPEQCIGRWAREGAPLGMECNIPYSNIFPKVEAEEPLESQMDMSQLENMKNYESVETQLAEAELEIERYEQCGYCRILPVEELHRRFPQGTASKLALILKQKADGSTKRRIVIDMKRSQGNSRAQVKERIILPRAQDVVASLRVMKAREHELKEEPQLRSILKGAQGYEESEIEFFLVDLQDAFCHFGVHPQELRHCVSPGLQSGTAILWIAMLFGFKAAPLVMGRLSAAIGRLTQSLFHPAAGQVQIYIDDLVLIIRGSRALRNLHMSKVLHVLAAFGVRIAMHKGERGRRFTWIGTTFDLQPLKIVLGAPSKMIDEIKETLNQWSGRGMVPTKELRSFLGKLACVAGIVPRLRWTVATLYAVLTKVLQEEHLEHERAQKRVDKRPKIGLVATKRMGTALPWLKAAFESPSTMLIRHEPLVEKAPVWGVVTDASPRGVGGVVIHKVGLRALQIWAPKFRGEPVVIRADSSVAL